MSTHELCDATLHRTLESGISAKSSKAAGQEPHELISQLHMRVSAGMPDPPRSCRKTTAVSQANAAEHALVQVLKAMTSGSKFRSWKP